ncbi:uncharacterized protein HaLaN_16176 [Haematococcus lacustris]|uniref:Uncharacterized protein n=1 Tax=Haematococcus lacustris TaxID=44745 RepID=A0A699Z9D3_HAELA|nr:uncharacterized protein HaLaN_16176 [Haematococcus lacustris]
MRASSQELHPVYQQVKASVCCRLADSVAQYWIALTVCAWTLLGSTWVAMLLLKRLDRVPPVHACCACACLLRSHLNAVTLLQPLTTGTPGPPEGGGDAPPRWSPGGRKEGFHGPMGPSATVVVHAMDRDHPNMAAPMQAWGSPR